MAQLKRVRPGAVMDLFLEQNGDKTETWTMSGDGTLDVQLLTISPKGLTRAHNVPSRLGFPLDDKGRIKLDE